MSPTKKLTWLAAAVLATMATMARSQDFPSRPITLVAPFPAGSVTDGVTRAFGQGLQDVLGKTVVVENKAGAQGTIGAAYVARAKPDGYTLLVASSGMFVAKSLYKTLTYEPIDGFVPVSGIGATSMMFMVSEGSGYKSMADVTKAAKDGNMSVGFGSPSGQLALALYSTTAKVNPTPVSYRGIPQALTDLAGGHVSVAIVDIGSGVAQMGQSKMRAVAVSARSRIAAAPEVPTMDEAFPGSGVSLETIIAVTAPAGTPQAIVDKLDNAIRAALARPDVKARFAALTTGIFPLSAADLAARIKADAPQWEALIKKAGIEQQ